MSRGQIIGAGMLASVPIGLFVALVIKDGFGAAILQFGMIFGLAAFLLVGVSMLIEGSPFGMFRDMLP